MHVNAHAYTHTATQDSRETQHKPCGVQHMQTFHPYTHACTPAHMDAGYARARARAPCVPRGDLPRCRGVATGPRCATSSAAPSCPARPRPGRGSYPRHDLPCRMAPGHGRAWSPAGSLPVSSGSALGGTVRQRISARRGSVLHGTAPRAVHWPRASPALGGRGARPSTRDSAAPGLAQTARTTRTHARHARRTSTMPRTHAHRHARTYRHARTHRRACTHTHTYTRTHAPTHPPAHTHAHCCRSPLRCCPSRDVD